MPHSVSVVASRFFVWVTISCCLLAMVLVGVRAGAQVQGPRSGGGWTINPGNPLPDLTGTYTADDGGIYYVQQSGTTVWWAGLSVGPNIAEARWHRGIGFSNVFRGTLDSATHLTGEFVDVTRGRVLNLGTLDLSVDTSTPGAIKLSRINGSGIITSSWTQTSALDDTALNIFDRFDIVHKNDHQTIHDNLKPYRDQTVVYGHIVYRFADPFGFAFGFNDQQAHINFPTVGTQARDYNTFYKENPSGDGDKDDDFDFRLRIDLSKLEPDFYITGWGTRSSGPDVYSLKLNVAQHFIGLNYGATDGYMGAEGIMYGKDVYDTSFLPGWADSDNNSILLNGSPINGSIANPVPTPDCDFIQPCIYTDYVNPLYGGIQLGSYFLSAGGDGNFPPPPDVDTGNYPGTYVRVTGALVLDCGHFSYAPDDWGHTCDDDLDDPDQVRGKMNQEIHPIYSIDVINYPFRPEDVGTPRLGHNLTGTWAGTDGSTYYVRQVGNTIWWLGQERDRQPAQPTNRFNGAPLIGALQIADAMRAGNAPIDNNATCPDSDPVWGVQLGIPYPCWAFANVFKGTITEQADGSATIQGDWAGVPQSVSPGNAGGSGSFTVDPNRKVITPATPHTIFPAKLEKMYEPDDQTPPESFLNVGAPHYDARAQRFVTIATTIQARGEDSQGVGQSGVQNIWYRIYPRGSPAPSFTPVIGTSYTFSLSGADGEYGVDTYVTDNAGNDEFGHGIARTLTLDNTPPQISVTQPTPVSYPHNASITLQFAASDGAGSGVQSVSPSIDGLNTLGDGTAVVNGLTINLLTQMTLGTHTLTVNAVDNVTNASTQSVTFSIVVTADSTKGDVQQFLQSGAIKNAGEASSLLVKLNAAAAARSRGQCATAATQCQSFINEVQAQSGTGITASAAAIMVQDAQYLMTHCP